MVRKPYAFSENGASDFEFWSFSGLATCGVILSRDAGQLLDAVPAQPGGREGQQPIHLQALCFSLSVQCSIRHLRYLTLYYKILDFFA